MFYYNDGLCLCDECAKDADMSYGAWVEIPEEDKDIFFCDICGRNDWKEGEEE